MTDTDDAPVRIVSYDASWPSSFEAERAVLANVLEAWLVGSIEHVGSTAVPGLAAKPVIDIMAPVGDLDASRPAIAALTAVGYCHFPYRPERMHWFCKPSPAFRTHHLYLVPHDGPTWRERLLFRDVLRARPDILAEYAALKQRLATLHEFDRETYTDAKSPFVERVLGMASGLIRE
ncbi:MAG TPA: GrpB family protein [Polyangiaceae bacterium]|nr:GrpB family protein [Polyangiaceae bacterium]